MDQRAEGEGENALEGGPAFLHHRDDLFEARIGQHDPRRRFQRIERGLRLALPKEAERGVEHQQHRYRQGFGIFAQPQLQRDGGFEHPRHWRPEFLHRPANRMLRFLRDTIGPIGGKAAGRFSAGEARVVAVWRFGHGYGLVRFAAGMADL